MGMSSLKATGIFPMKMWRIQQATGDHPFRRLMEHVRIQYRSNAPRSPSAIFQDISILESLALPGETYKLAFHAWPACRGLSARTMQVRLPEAY